MRSAWCFALAALTAGCVTEATEDVPLANTDQDLAQQMSADSAYMRRTFQNQRRGTQVDGPINMADPAQYRFVTNRLTAAGKTPENSPELFARIRQSRERAIARATQTKTSFSASLATATDFCAGYILPGTEVKSGTSIIFNNTHPVVSCHGISSYTYADVVTFSMNLAGTEWFQVGLGAWAEDFTGQAVFVGPSISPAFPAALGRLNYTDSYAIAYDAAGVEQYTYLAIETGVVPAPPTPAAITLEHPKFHPWISNGGNIEMCELRGSPTQCDYAVGSLTSGVFTGWVTNAAGVFTGIAGVALNTGTATVPWAADVSSYVAFSTPYDGSHLYLPTIGTVDVGATGTANCSIVSIDAADFNLLKTVTGGACSTNASFRTSVTFAPGSRTGSFRTITNFTNNGGTANPPSTDCTLSAIVNEAVRPAIIIRATANCGGTVIPRFAAMGPGGGPALPQQVFFLNSCFAEGTPIRRADGSSVAIEKIKSGDKVISDSKGTLLTVTGTSYGGEREPLVKLRDNKGHEVRITAKHPVIKASGEVVFAEAIRKSDRVMTDRGVASIVSVARVPYTGKVYNLKLGTPEEQAKVGKDGTTMFAAGFMVGDSTMQQAHSTPHRTVAEVSPQWQRDYQHSLARPTTGAHVLK